MDVKAGLARFVYGSLLRALSPVYALRLWWRGRAEPLYRQAIGERFGRYAGTAVPGAVWIHAVSLGETRAAQALVDALRAEQPSLRLLLTHGTATGREAGAALLRAGDAQTWLPYDTPGATRRFLAHWRPAAGVLMETEVWPNLMRSAAAAGVPVLLANARLSEKSLRRGARFAVLLRPAFAAPSRVLAQTEADAVRLRDAGAPRVDLMGNPKFDVDPDARCAGSANSGQRQAAGRWCCASTREGGEAALLAAWRPGPRRARGCCWCLATRSDSTRSQRWSSAVARRCRAAVPGSTTSPARWRRPPTSGWGTRCARCRPTTRRRASRCSAAASSRWAGRT